MTTMFKVGDLIQWKQQNHLDTPIYKILDMKKPDPMGAILYLEDVGQSSAFKGKRYPAHYTKLEWVNIIKPAKKKVFK